MYVSSIMRNPTFNSYANKRSGSKIVKFSPPKTYFILEDNIKHHILVYFARTLHDKEDGLCYVAYIVV